MEKIMYSLAHKETGELIKYTESSNEGNDFCNSTTVTLYSHGDTDWLVEKLDSAMWVKYGKGTPWYNSDIDNPTIGYDIDPDEYEPIKVVMHTEKLDMPPDFLCLEEDEFISSVDYDGRSNVVSKHTHKYLVVWFVEDTSAYEDKIGVKIKTNSYAYRILVWSGVYQGKNAIIVSNEYYE